MKSFKSLQDERFHRKLTRKNEHLSRDHTNENSLTRQNSDVRELIPTQEDVKMFETKFKGSL
jgi:hypothetical protein